MNYNFKLNIYVLVYSMFYNGFNLDENIINHDTNLDIKN